MLVVLKSTTTCKNIAGLKTLLANSSNWKKSFLISSQHYFSQQQTTAADFSASTGNVKLPPTFPLSTKVVICGGGLFGTSVAYHLAHLGYKEVILVTRDKLGSGSSRFSTGLVETIKVSTTETLLSKYTANLYKKLQDEGHNLS